MPVGKLEEGGALRGVGSEPGMYGRSRSLGAAAIRLGGENEAPVERGLKKVTESGFSGLLPELGGGSRERVHRDAVRFRDGPPG